MSVRYRIDVAKRRVYVTTTVQVDGAALSEGQRRMAADPDFDPGFSRLIDLSAVESFDVSAAVVRSLAERAAVNSRTRRAIVVNKPLVLGLSRMFQILTAPNAGAIEIFSDGEAAERWLDAG